MAFSDPATLLASGVGAAAVLLVLALGRTLAARRDPVRARLASISGVSPFVADPDASSSVLRDQRTSRIPLLDALLRDRAWSTGTRRSLERAGLRLRVGEYLLLRALSAAFCAALGVWLGFSAFGPDVIVVGVAGGALAGFMVPALWLRRRIGARGRRIEQQLVELTELMASMLSSGFGYMQALMSVADQLEPPLADEVARLVDAVKLGGDTDEALELMRRRIASRDFDIVATAITVHRSTGGDLAEILRGVARTVRDRQSFVREIATLTSRERYSALIVAGFPFLIAAGLTALAPDVYGVLLSATAGRLILLAAVVLDTVGYLTIKRVARITI